MITSLKQQCVAVALAELLVLDAIGAAVAQDLAAPPGYLGWTIINDCEHSIRVALHYAPEDEILTEGWWTIEPDGTVEVLSTTEYVAYFVAPAAGTTGDESELSGPGAENGVADADVEGDAVGDVPANNGAPEQHQNPVESPPAEDAAGSYALAIDPQADFSFTGFEPPPGLQDARYTAVDIDDDWSVTSIPCGVDTR